MPHDKRPEIYGVDENIPDGMLSQLKYPVSDWNNPMKFILDPVGTVRSWLRFSKRVLKGVWKSTFRKKVVQPPVE